MRGLPSTVVAMALAIGLFSTPKALAQRMNADSAAKLLIGLCVGGGSITITKSTTSEDQFRIGGSGRSMLVEKREVSGLIDGINNAISNLGAGQADKVRECMKPYIGRLMNLALGDQDSDQMNVRKVSGTVQWGEAPSSSRYDWIGEYSYIYKNYSTARAKCRFVARGILKKKSDNSTYKRFQHATDDFSLAPNATYEVTGEVGVEGNNDRNYTVSIDTKIDCWSVP